MAMYKVVFKFISNVGSQESQDSFEENIYYSFAAEKTDEGIKVTRNNGWLFTYEPNKPVLKAKTIGNSASLYEWTMMFKNGIYERKFIWTKNEDIIECIVTDENVAKWIVPFQDETIVQNLSDDSNAILALWKGCSSENDCVILHDWILRHR